MQKQTYRCDICASDGSSYYGYNETHGYCDNVTCHERANEKNADMVRDAIYAGDFTLADELAGDGDISDML